MVQILLTERDLSLFRFLHTYGLARTGDVASAIFPGIALTTVLRRLRKLEQHDLIARIEGLPLGAVAWRVTDKGAAKISDEPPKRYFPKQTLEHDLLLLDLRLALERNKIATSWLPEHALRRKMAQKFGTELLNRKAVPDGLMTATYKGTQESIAIELELHCKNRDRYRRTFSDYKSKTSILAVWYLVATSGLGKHLASLWQEVPGGGPYFLWSCYQTVLENPLEASIHSLEPVFKVRELFPPSEISLPAQSPAHLMSTEVNFRPTETNS